MKRLRQAGAECQIGSLSWNHLMSDQKVFFLPKAMSKQTQEGNYDIFCIHICLNNVWRCFFNSRNSPWVSQSSSCSIPKTRGTPGAAWWWGICSKWDDGVGLFQDEKRSQGKAPLETICRLLEVALCICVLFSWDSQIVIFYIYIYMRNLLLSQCH